MGMAGGVSSVSFIFGKTSKVFIPPIDWSVVFKTAVVSTYFFVINSASSAGMGMAGGVASVSSIFGKTPNVVNLSNLLNSVNVCGDASVPPARRALPVLFVNKASPSAFVIKSFEPGVVARVLVGLLLLNVFVPVNVFGFPARKTSPPPPKASLIPDIERAFMVKATSPLLVTSFIPLKLLAFIVNI